MDENCHVEPVEKVATADERQKIETVVLAVSGMGCPNCANRVHNSLISLQGVVDAYVDHTAGAAQVNFNPDLASVEALIGAVASAGGNDGRHEYGARLVRQL